MSTPDTLAELSLTELRGALGSNETTALAITEACLARIRMLEPRVRAFVTLTADEALAAARAADAAVTRGQAGPLAGVPIAVKDLFAVRGVVRTNGSAAFADDPPVAADATVVAALRAAGAVIVGTTHMHELAYGPTGVNPALGTPLNPWAEDRVPGGSSSGSGAAVAARMVPAALGSDTGGSIRVPASFCGISGLKPTYGRVSRAGMTPLAWTLDHAGPLACSAEDLATVLQVIAGYDPADPTSARLPVPDYTAGLERSLRGVRIGVPRHFCGELLDPEVAVAFDAALADLRAAGATLADVALPALAHASPALGAVILAEAGATLPSLLGARRRDRVGIEIRVYLEISKAITAQHYLAAQRLRTRLYEEIRAAFTRVDLLATPTTIIPAPRPGELAVRVRGSEVGVLDAIGRLTGPFNLTGLPALSVPAGFTQAGLPIGLQLVGRPFAEADLLAVGHAYQSATDWHRLRPTL